MTTSIGVPRGRPLRPTPAKLASAAIGAEALQSRREFALTRRDLRHPCRTPGSLIALRKRLIVTRR